MQGVWLLPSLNRAALVREFFECYKKTQASTNVWVLVDKTDPLKDEYLKLKLPGDSRIIITDGISLGDKIREVFEQVKDFDWVGILNDDHRPLTKHWDQKVIAQINGTNAVFTNDGVAPDKPWNFPNRICGAICFSGKVIRTLGYIYPGTLQHYYSDDIWGFLFSKAQCLNGIQDVCVHHDHAYLDDKKKDATFYHAHGPEGLVNGEGRGGYWIEDKKWIESWMGSGQASKDAQKIIDIQPKTGVMIATPSHDGNVAMGYALGLTDTALFLQQHNVYFEMARVVGSSLIPHARNSLVDIFLSSKCQRLCMIDADQGFDKAAFLALFQTPRPIIAGITPHKRFPINLNFEPLPEDHKYFKSLSNKGFDEFQIFAKEKADVHGAIEVNRAGTGCIMIDRSVFETMREHVGEYQAFDDRPEATHKEFFKMGAVKDEVNKKYRGEDWQFCELAKELKIPIYISARSVLTHTGSFVFGS